MRTRIFRRWREAVMAIATTVGVIANFDSFARLVQAVLDWLRHLNLP